MKKSIYLIVCLILFFIFHNKPLFAEESMLTLKQQLDRLQREVNDLSKSVFKNSNKSNENFADNNDSQTVNFAAIDMRIYDLEKDIKTLHSNFEDLVFEFDEIKSLFDELSIKEIKKIEPKLNEKVLKIFDLKNSIKSKKSYGGTSFENIKKMLNKYKKELK